MFINADFLVNSLFNTERYQFTPANYIGFFFMLSCNGPTLSEWESTPHVANIPLWCFVAVTENTPLHDCMVFLGPFSRRKEVGTIVLVCQTNCIAWLQAKWYPVFCKVHYQNLFLWFQCSVRELINKPKQSGPIFPNVFAILGSSPVRPQKTTRGKCVCYTSS